MAKLGKTWSIGCLICNTQIAAVNDIDHIQGLLDLHNAAEHPTTVCGVCLMSVRPGHEQEDHNMLIHLNFENDFDRICKHKDAVLSEKSEALAKFRRIAREMGDI